MRAIEITEPGGADVLSLTNRPAPSPGQGEVLIKVAAAGINRPDILQRKGFYPPPEGASDLPGLEVSGTIEALGPGAVGEVGSRVMALLPGGGYAEYAVADYRHVLIIPDELSFTDAAALPETLYTVFTNVIEDGRLAEGERLFVHGATSGIGTMAAKLAAHVGATVYGTAGSAAKCREAKALGYQKCFNYREDDWVQQMREAGGADVVLDMIGGDYVARNLQLLNENGRHVSIAFQGGMEATIAIPQLMQKHLTLTGSTLRRRPPGEKARLTDEIRSRIMPAVESGDIRPVVDCTFPLENAAAAHRRMEDGAHVGKIVLTL